jgi:curved DNA-binding protein
MLRFKCININNTNGMEIKEAYNILGISNKSSKDDIKKAYKKLVLKYHPDKNNGDPVAEEKFKKIIKAYETIENNYNVFYTKQKSYDSYDINFADLFDTYFGSRFTTKRINTTITLTLEEVIKGTTKEIYLDNSLIKTTINIPPGVKHNQIIEQYTKEYNVEYYINIHIKISNNTDYNIIGLDLSTTIKVNLYTCILGGVVEVKTLDGVLKINIPKETQSGKIFKLKGKGLPVYKGYGMRGDLYIIIQPLLPTNISNDDLELFKILEKNQNKIK